LMFANLTTFAHFSMSSAIRRQYEQRGGEKSWRLIVRPLTSRLILIL
jgi:hypothetical protein